MGFRTTNGPETHQGFPELGTTGRGRVDHALKIGAQIRIQGVAETDAWLSPQDRWVAGVGEEWVEFEPRSERPAEMAKQEAAEARQRNENDGAKPITSR